MSLMTLTTSKSEWLESIPQDISIFSDQFEAKRKFHSFISNGSPILSILSQETMPLYSLTVIATHVAKFVSISAF